MKEKEISKEIQIISEKLDKFASQLSKLLEVIEEMQQKVKKLKETKTYAAATGQNNSGKRIVTSEMKSLGLRIKGFPEPQGTAADEILQDRQAVQSILDQLQVKGRITRLLRVGHRKETAAGKSASPKESQVNSTPDSTPARTIIIDVDIELDKSEVLKSAYTLLNYMKVGNPIFIGPELSRKDLIKKREVLKLKRELISQGRGRKELRVRNLTLQERVENEWRVY